MTCPWDKHFWLVPITDRESGDISGYGKMSMELGRSPTDSYTKVGKREWISFQWIKVMFGRGKAHQLVVENYFNKAEQENGMTLFEVTECMLALLFSKAAVVAWR